MPERQSIPVSAIEQAYNFASRGDPAAGVAVLEAAGDAGSAEAWMELALWYLQGRIVSRDLGLVRKHFGSAADLGNDQARMIHLSLLANGTGGPSEWPTALSLLEQLAAKDDGARRQLELIEAMDLTPAGSPAQVPESETISQHPRAEIFAGLLTDAECDYLIEAAGPRLKPAIVIDSNTGRTMTHPVRTSDTAGFPWLAETPFIHATNRRIAAASRTEVECGEPLQVLRYRPGQQYKPHHDGLEAETNQRILTMLVYLNDGYEGGETMFMRTGLKVAGTRGSALLFRNADGDGNPDPMSEHAGLPVISGEKLIASRWIRQERFGPL